MPKHMLYGYEDYVFDVSGNLNDHYSQSNDYSGTLSLSVHEANRNQELFRTDITISPTYGPHLLSINPNWFYSN
jgi:hypothetical protein